MTEIFIGITIAAVAAALAAAWVAVRALRARESRADSSELTMLVQSEFNRLAEALVRQSQDGRELRDKFSELHQVLDRLQIESEKRGQSEEAWWGSIRRLETVLAGGASRGRAGENLLHDALSLLPPGMVVTDFRVNGKVVEFALALPDGSHLPVDVKWTAVHELEALEKTEDPEEQNARARDVEDKVARRAREVASYIEPPLTTPFAVACVPDAAYNICKKAHVDAYHRGVFIVPYSSAVPTVLCLHLLASRFGGAGDARTALAEIGTILSDMGNTWEHKVVKATTMLQNAAEEWRGHLGKASGAVARGRGVGGVGGEVVDLTDGSRPSLEVVESPEPVA